MLKFNGKNLKIENGNKKKFVFKILFLFCLILFGIFASQNAQAATSYFGPSSGNFTVGNIFTVNILVNTEGVAINNAEAVINFPSDLLEIISVTKSGSIFPLWIEEPTFSNSAGTISFNGGLPTPGFNGTAGKIFSAAFRVKKEGSASLIFSSATVRANDGYGTDVFKIGVQASFNLIPEEKSLPLPPGTPEAPSISSPTHPDPEKWYSNQNPEFTWKLPPDVTAVRLLYDEYPTSRPSVIYKPPISDKQLENVENGIWYFHAQFSNAKGWGEIAHFRFQIDTERPSQVVAKSAIFRIGTWANSFLAIVVPLVALIIVFLFILRHGWHRFSMFRKKLKKEVREAESAVHRAFDLLKEDIRGQVKILEQTRTKRRLTEEEEKIVKQLKRDLDNAEKFISKEIEDIEREVK